MNNKGSQFFNLSSLGSILFTITAGFVLLDRIEGWDHNKIAAVIYIILVICWISLRIASKESYNNLLSRIRNIEKEVETKSVIKDENKETLSRSDSSTKNNTQYSRIVNMSPHQLSRFLSEFTACPCNHCTRYKQGKPDCFLSDKGLCQLGFEEWLESEVEK